MPSYLEGSQFSFLTPPSVLLAPLNLPVEVTAVLDDDQRRLVAYLSELEQRVRALEP